MSEEKIISLIEEQLSYLGTDAKPLYRIGYNTALKDLLRVINFHKDIELKRGMVELGLRNFQLINDAVKMTGSYDPVEIFCIFEENLFVHECDTIYMFLEWVAKDIKNRAFGHGNYEKRFTEFLNY